MNAKVKLILSSILFFCLVLGTLIYLNFKRLEGDTAWVDHSHQVIHSVQKAYASLKEAQVDYLEFLLTRKDISQHRCRSALESTQEELRSAAKLVNGDPFLEKDLELLTARAGERIADMQAGLAYVEAGRSDLALSHVQGDTEKKRYQEIKAIVDRMTGMQVWLLKTRKAFEDTHLRTNSRFILAIALGGALFFTWAFYFIIRQINERQGMLNTLRSSEEKFRFLAETANDTFLTADAHGLITDVNPAGEGLFGYTKAELVGQPLETILSKKFVEDRGEGVFQSFLSMTLGARSLELYGRRKDQSEFPLEVSVSQWKNRDGVFYTNIIRDITDRKFFIKTLLNNEHRLFQFLDAVPVSILVRDPTGTLYFVNQAGKELYAIDRSNSYVTTEETPEAFRLFQAGTEEPYPADRLPTVRALAGEKSHVEDMEIHRGGQVISLEAWGAPILDENGQVKYGLAAIMDVSSQIQITLAMKEREEFFRNLFEEGPIGMILSFADGILVNTNRAFCDMLGFPKGDLVGRSYFDHTFPEDTAAERNLDQKLFDKTLPKYQIEKRFIDRKGQTLWCKVSASIIRDVQDEPLFRLAIVENITEQKEAETAMRESEQRFRTLAESANDAIISADSTGAVIFFNPSAQKIFGYSREEFMGQPISRLMSQDSWKANQALIQRYLTSGHATIPGRTLELIGQRKSGETFPAEISYFAWKTTAGLFFTSIMRDITERKQVEEMKNDLISVVSHQLKTPVAQINGFIENILEGLAGEVPPRLREYLYDMRDISQENYRLISDLLSLSKIERGVLTVDLAPVELQPIVELTVRDYGPMIERKGLEFKVAGPDQGIEVLADQDKTVETLRNILNNAVKCTDKGSISVNWGREDGFGWITIADTGIGMDQETLERLFNKSRVLGPEAGRAGAGLGLYIAKNFMEIQKGEISVDSTPGRGTTFRIKLPVNRP